MQIGINAPWHDGEVEHTAFNLYAMTTERNMKIESFIDCLVNSDDPNNWGNQWIASKSSGISFDSMTSQEREYIEQEVSHRWLITHM